MGEPSPPTALMRLVLAVVTVATTFVTAGPVIVILGVMLSLAFFGAAAVMLAHTNALTSATFASAHRAGLIGLVLFFIAALTVRVVRRDAKGLSGLLSRRPLLSFAVVLPALSLVIVGVEWNHARLPELAGALIVDGLYFFSAGAWALMLVAGVLAARGIYRWAARERFRAGLVTGSLAVLLTLVSIGGRYTTNLLTASSAQQTSPPPSPALQRDMELAMKAGSWIETERLLLVGFETALQPGYLERAAPAIAAPPKDSDDLRACIEQLVGEADQVKRSVGFRFGLSDDDAHDIVHDALLNVCNAHARKAYTRLGAVLQRAADRRASRWAWRRSRRCEVDYGWPVCSPAADEIVRFEQEDVILDGALCEEAPLVQEIIRLRVMEDRRFADIGTRLGLAEDDARAKYNNALRRIRKRLANVCDP
jgi:DNA-directed RNA polymerase specialized sigma24 family protein